MLQNTENKCLPMSCDILELIELNLNNYIEYHSQILKVKGLLLNECNTVTNLKVLSEYQPLHTSDKFC